MVQEEHRAEVDLRDVGHRGARTAADRQKVETREHDHDQRTEEGAEASDGFAVEEPQHAAVAPDHRRGIEGEEQQLPHAEPEIDARHRLPGIGQVDQDRRIEAEAPMFIKGDIHGEDRRRDQRDEDEVARQDTPPEALRQPHPQREQRYEQRHDRHVARDGHVERQPVPEDTAPAAESRFGGFGGVVGQKNGFLHGHHHDGGGKNDQYEQQLSLHSVQHLRFVRGGCRSVRSPAEGARIRSSRRRPDRPRRRCPERYTSARSAPRRRPPPRSSSSDAACSSRHSQSPAPRR